MILILNDKKKRIVSDKQLESLNHQFLIMIVSLLCHGLYMLKSAFYNVTLSKKNKTLEKTLFLDWRESLG